MSLFLSKCTICDESFNQNKHTAITCIHCNQVACRACCIEYLNISIEPICMFPDCKRPWTRKFCAQSFTKTFMRKTYRQLRETYLFNREQSLLPATQIIVEEYHQHFKLLDQIIVIYKGYVHQLMEQFRQFHTKITRYNEQYINTRHLIQPSQHENVRYCKNINRIIHTHNIDIKYFQSYQNNLLKHMNNGVIGFLNPRALHFNMNTLVASHEREHVFVRACANNDCRGFLSSQWKCGLCQLYTCSQCHILKGRERNDDNHVCNPDDIATASLLKKDSKPCPKCASVIFKISGCDQMWCTICSTAFSWKTGKLVQNGIIHNPHYFEWMRRTGGEADRNPGEIRCGRELTRQFRRELENKIRRIHTQPTQHLIDRVNNIIGSINHVADLNGRDHTDVENNLIHRFNYLTNQISMEQFKTNIQRANKRFHQKREMREILNTFVQTSTDIMYDFYDSLNVEKLNELDRFIEYINTECFPEIKTVYGTTTLYNIVLRGSPNNPPTTSPQYNNVLINLNYKSNSTFINQTTGAKYRLESVNAVISD